MFTGDGIGIAASTGTSRVAWYASQRRHEDIHEMHGLRGPKLAVVVHGMRMCEKR
jgi:hypothetical protein